MIEDLTKGLMATRIVYIKVALEIDKNADPDEVVQELDYDIKHPDIISTEIREIEYEGEEQECIVICQNCKTRHDLAHMMWEIITCSVCGADIENKLIDEGVVS